MSSTELVDESFLWRNGLASRTAAAESTGFGDMIQSLQARSIARLANQTAAAESAGFGSLGPHITLDMILSLEAECMKLMKVREMPNNSRSHLFFRDFLRF